MNCFRAAPGGMSQIVLVAMATGADVAMISSYHILEYFYIICHCATNWLFY